MKRTLAIGILLLAGLAGASVAQESPCPTYGCSASILPLASGGYVVYGTAELPMTWYPEKPPAGDALVVNLDDERAGKQAIRIDWVRRDYICCCPSDWFGEFADVLTVPVKPGDRLEITIGTQPACRTEIVAPVAESIAKQAAAGGAAGAGRTR